MARKRYRIEQIEGQNSSVNKKSVQELDPKLTKKLVNEKMYLYIDINAGIFINIKNLDSRPCMSVIHQMRMTRQKILGKNTKST